MKTEKQVFGHLKVHFSLFRSFRWLRSHRVGRFVRFGGFVSVVSVVSVSSFRWFRFGVSGFCTCRIFSDSSPVFHFVALFFSCKCRFLSLGFACLCINLSKGFFHTESYDSYRDRRLCFSVHSEIEILI